MLLGSFVIVTLFSLMLVMPTLFSRPMRLVTFGFFLFALVGLPVLAAAQVASGTTIVDPEVAKWTVTIGSLYGALQMLANLVVTLGPVFGMQKTNPLWIIAKTILSGISRMTDPPAPVK